MPTTRNFNELIENLSPERRERIEAGVRRLELRTLIALLSQYTGQTPLEVKTSLHLDEAQLDNLELHDELTPSVMSGLIRRLGGELEIIIKFPQASLSITDFQVPDESDFEAESIARRLI